MDVWLSDGQRPARSCRSVGDFANFFLPRLIPKWLCINHALLNKQFNMYLSTVLASFSQILQSFAGSNLGPLQVLMDADPGLRRRFSLVLQLEDYSPEELAEICTLIC